MQLDLGDFCKRAYGTQYVETLRITVSDKEKFYSDKALFQIHANCRIRRCYFADRHYTEEELPAEFKLYLPVRESTRYDDDEGTRALNDPDLEDQKIIGGSKMFQKPTSSY